MQFKLYTIHVISQSLVCVITPTVLRASHPLFVCHHTRHRYSYIWTIEDITSSLYEFKPPFLWYYTHYIWHRIDDISVTTSTLLMISHQLYLWDLICYICRHHIHCIQQHIYFTCTITATVHTLHYMKFRLYDINHQYLGHHKHCIHDIKSPIYDITSTIYYISSPIPVTSQSLYR